ncbi:MAG: ATP-binding cassette domain-containing protein [Pseudomonadota bacterium]|nr:ATP-binding cassette domain-containing protein [Pseudomonadota bacterium]
MINLNGVTLRRGGRVLLEAADCTIHGGERVGLVGRNGSGKSSLFALLLGEIEPDAGAVSLPPDLTIATVAQETGALPVAAREHVLSGDEELVTLEAQLREIDSRGHRVEDSQRLANIHERLHAIGGYAARSRAARLMRGLGFAAGDEQRPVAEFSGGWRERLNLARALMCRADLLLLDEPTNHLDLDAVLWLQQYLSDCPGTLLVISHDRDFLDAVTGRTLHIERHALRSYAGNYSRFERTRSEQQAAMLAQHQAQVRRAEQMRQFVERFRAKATKARQAQSRLKQIERMQIVEPAHWDDPFHFSFPEPQRLPRQLVSLERVAAGYGAARILQDVSLSLMAGDRIGLLGRNGAGKTTLIRTLAEELPPLAGQLSADRYLNVGYFAQHQIEQLDAAASPLDHLHRLDDKADFQSLRNFLGGFDFVGDRALEPVGPMSGGERARLALALIAFRRPNLLLLDEPTNHLDLDMRHALEVALQQYPGAMVLVSHDRHLIDSTCDTLWLVSGGRCATFHGDLDDYARHLRDSQRVDTLPEGPVGSGSTTDTGPAARRAGGGREKRQHAARRRADVKPLRDRVRTAERLMERLAAEIADLDRQLADPSLYSGAPQTLAPISRRRGELTQDLERAETEWLEASDALESALAGQAGSRLPATEY